MQSIYSTYDPVSADLNRYLARESAADSLAEAIDLRADAIATNPTRDQFADVFGGCNNGQIEKLRAAWLNGKQAFFAAVEAHMNAGFVELASLEIDESEALACDAREVLRDW